MAAAGAALPKRSKKASKPPLSSDSARNPEKRPIKKRKQFEDAESVSPKRRRAEGELDSKESSTSSPKQIVMLKVSKPKKEEPYPCCLCVSRDPADLLRVHARPRGKSGCQNWNPNDPSGQVIWRAHGGCARIVPETWVDEVQDENGNTERLVFGVDAIVKDRWNLVS